MEDRYYHTPDSVKEYIHLAKDVDGKQLIARFRGFLGTDSTLLELGSGPGKDWKLLSETFDVTGSDYSEEFLRYLRSQFPEGQFLHLDAASLETDQTFGGIYSNKVLHHLNDAEIESSVRAQAKVLEPQGVICHSFWRGEGSEVFKGMFVNYHNESVLRDLFGDHFEILVLEPYKEFDEEDSLLLIARLK